MTPQAEEEYKTAKEWEEHFIPKGLRLHSYHGFGAQYPAQHCWPEGFDSIKMTEQEFINRCMSCGQTGLPKEWIRK